MNKKGGSKRQLAAARTSKKKKAQARKKQATKAAARTAWPDKVRELAEKGVAPDHIRINLGLDLSTPERQERFDRIVEQGHAKWCQDLQLAIAGDALGGKVTAQKLAGEAWLDRYSDVEASAWSRRIPDGGLAVKERLLKLIAKHKKARKRELAESK